MTIAVEQFPHHHAVQFYAGDQSLVEQVANYLAEGLAQREPCVVFVTQEHRSMLQAHLARLGLDSDAISFIDARDCLASFMRKGSPDRDAFLDVIGTTLDRVRTGKGRVRAFGEMVDVLWGEGHLDAAIQLERLWNELSARSSFNLLCSYRMDLFSDPAASAGFDAICEEHTFVRATEHPTGADGEDGGRRLAMLEQRAAALEKEIANRTLLENRLAEALTAHRRSEEVLRDFVDNGAVGLHWVTADGTIEWANEAELRLLGYARDEYVGRNITEFHADPDVIDDILSRLSGGEEIRDYEARLLAKDGAIKWVSISSNGLFEDGKLVHTRCFTHDITARKRLEEQNDLLLEASDVLTRSLDLESRLDALSGMVVPRIADWCAIDLVEAGSYERVCVSHRNSRIDEEIIGRVRNHRIDPEHDPVMRVLASGEPFLVSSEAGLMLAGLSGDPQHARDLVALGTESMVVVPMTGYGRVIGALTLVSSTPARRFAALDLPVVTNLAMRAGGMIELARLYQHAERASRAKDEFLATLSHELRTPLTAITGWSRMLSLGGLDDETFQVAIGSIEQAGQNLGRLVDDLLDLSRVVSGKLTLQTEPVNLCRVVGDAAATMRLAAEAKRVDIEIYGDSSPLIVQGDSMRLQQVVWNLLSNAIKFSESGARVRVELERTPGQGVIRVRDEGCGIDPSFLPHVFEPFRQADAGTTREHGGLGLGLAVVRYLTEAHGGTVRVESAGNGAGTIFTLSLPLLGR